MDKLLKQQRIKSIFRMLLEIANGNLTHRIAIDGHDAQFDELAKLLNEIAEKLQKIGYASPYANSKTNIEASNDVAVIIVQKVLDYIQNHLEEPLPSTKNLAKMFGTNEFKLKELFRNYFNTSIYQFYNDERLKKAHQMIEQTNIPLKEIAYSIGFNDYVIFSKAFKKKFKYPPSQLKRDL
jgi:transcriptional regulator GlxA family with amidase domain